MAALTYSDFWGPAVGAYSLLYGKNPILHRERRVANRIGNRVNRALLDALIGAVTGGTASSGHYEVAIGRLTPNGGQADPGYGGVGAITDIGRTTTAADVATLKEFLVNINVRPSYPRDLSGNGGPALNAAAAAGQYP